jgi:transcriptional regulator with XRE-family HTH domain
MIYEKEKEEELLKNNISKAIVSLLEKHEMTQKDLSVILGVDNSTIGKWIKKKAIPRMGVIQKMSDYFKVEKTYFLEHEQYLIKKEESPYYLNKETREIAQEAFENPELRILFDAARDADPEDLKIAIEMIKRMKKKERHED